MMTEGSKSVPGTGKPIAKGLTMISGTVVTWEYGQMKAEEQESKGFRGG
jgi:hypothetical protein